MPSVLLFVALWVLASFVAASLLGRRFRTLRRHEAVIVSQRGPVRR